MIRSETAEAKILLQRTPVKQKPQIIMALDQKFKEQKRLWTFKGGFGDVNKRPESTCRPTGVPSLDFIPSTSNLWICQILAHVVAFSCPPWAKCSCGQFAVVRKYQVNKQQPGRKSENPAGSRENTDPQKNPSVGRFNTHARTQRSQHGECEIITSKFAALCLKYEFKNRHTPLLVPVLLVQHYRHSRYITRLWWIFGKTWSQMCTDLHSIVGGGHLF